ncbi:17310_t:CDS:2, partial [Cetraspora pellucida]
SGYIEQYCFLMMNISKNSVTIKDESSSTNSDIDLTQKNDVDMTQRAAQTNFEANFSRISVEMLKFLCYEIGVSVAGLKQNLVGRLVNKSKKRFGLPGLDNSKKGKMVDIDKGVKEVYKEGSKSDFESGKAFAKVFNNGLVVTDNEEAKGYNDQSLLHLPFLASDTPFIHVSSLYIPLFVQSQLFINPNWQQVFSQRMFTPPSLNNIWNEMPSRDLAGPSFTNQQPVNNS